MVAETFLYDSPPPPPPIFLFASNVTLASAQTKLFGGLHI